MRRLLTLCCLLLIVTCSATAQDTPADAETGAVLAYVTTQDFSSLRAGPSTAFERLAVVPPVVTLPAYGRTSDTQWIQVSYEGQLGWIASILLVWSGNVIDLPVDGINPSPFIRRAAALAVTVRDTPYYASVLTIAPGYVLGTIPQGTTLELTGRAGEGGHFRVQTRYQGQLVWIGTYNLRVTEGNVLRLLNLSYLFTYGRLFITLQENYALALTSYGQIRDVWVRIRDGNRVSCLFPPIVPRALVPADVTKEPTFEGAVIALNKAVDGINESIAAFELACEQGVTVEAAYIAEQIALLAEVERNMVITGSLIEPLRNRNPLE